MINNNKNYKKLLKCSIENIIVMSFFGLIFSAGINAQTSYYTNNLSFSPLLNYNLQTNYPYNNISSFFSNNYFDTYGSFQYQSPFLKDQYWNPSSFYPNSLYHGSLFNQNDFYSRSLYTTSLFPSSTFSGLLFSSSLSPLSLFPNLTYPEILFPDSLYPFQPSQKTEPKPSPKPDSSSTDDEIPEWLLEKMVGAMSNFVALYVYKGELVYYIPPRCCDIFSAVYNFEGTLICRPDGGNTRYGDGSCPDFFSEAKKVGQITEQPFNLSSDIRF